MIFSFFRDASISEFIRMVHSGFKKGIFFHQIVEVDDPIVKRNSRGEIQRLGVFI